MGSRHSILLQVWYDNGAEAETGPKLAGIVTVPLDFTPLTAAAIETPTVLVKGLFFCWIHSYYAAFLIALTSVTACLPDPLPAENLPAKSLSLSAYLFLLFRPCVCHL